MGYFAVGLRPRVLRFIGTICPYSFHHAASASIAAKILGPLAVLARFSVALSDLAYAGIFYHLLLSGLAHLGVRKPKGAGPAAVGLVLLAVSFLTQNVARDGPSPYAPAKPHTIEFQPPRR